MPAVHGPRRRRASASRASSRSSRAVEAARDRRAGRCLPYGEGSRAGRSSRRSGAARPDVEPSAAHATPSRAAARRLAELLDGRPAQSRSRRRRRSGRCAGCSRPSRRRQPLVLVVDDLHWAEPTFLDLVEHLADWARDAPLLLAVHGPAGAARHPARLGRRQARTPRSSCSSRWPTTRRATCCGHLARRRRGSAAALRRGSSTAAEGNPLFVEEVVAMLIDDGVARRGTGRAAGRADAIAVPPTIQALLARGSTGSTRRARGRRGGVGRGQGVRARARRGARRRRAPRASIGALLRALVRKDLIRPAARRGRPSASATSSSATPPTRACRRSSRAELHERFADWLEARPSAFPRSSTSSLGYHLERAVQLAASSASRRGHARRSRRARRRSLAAAGRRAAQRDDPRPRARCSSAPSRWSRPTSWRAARCCPRSAPRSSRPAAWPRRSLHPRCWIPPAIGP